MNPRRRTTQRYFKSGVLLPTNLSVSKYGAFAEVSGGVKRKQLFERVNDELAPAQDAYERLMAAPAELEEILKAVQSACAQVWPCWRACATRWGCGAIDNETTDNNHR